jgi:uncharacterized protein YjiS (DUF1127 family)
MAQFPETALLVEAASPHLTGVQEREMKMTILRKLNQFATYQRTVRALNRLDNRQLNDIGVAREEIAALARGRAL